MKEVKLSATLKAAAWEELDKSDRQLIEAAKAASEKSYAIYSHFNVGAAVRLVDGTIITGNNQENAAYPSGLCAERTTLFYTNANYPDTAVECLAIAARTGGHFIAEPISPCGACRQVILETEKRYGYAIRILLYGEKETIIVEEGIKALLPLSFGSEFLE